MDNNKIILHGTVACAPTFSHRTRDTDFYAFDLSVPRLSGTPDILPVLVRASLAEGLSEGHEITVEGSVRSYNNKSGSGRRLVLDVFADDWTAESCEPSNELHMSGRLCREPQLRRTPLGRTVCDVLVAVPRAYGRSDYLPAIAWGSTAHDVSRMSVGDEIAFDGRFQSRIYYKDLGDGAGEKRTAYEISIQGLRSVEDGESA